MTELFEYDNGLRLIVSEISFVRSVNMSILVNTGSAYEDEHNNGISHFIEHMNFKGTSRYSAFDLSTEFDKIGAFNNAYTSKENTTFLAKSTDIAAERSFELLSEMVLCSAYQETEMEKEKNVIIEEINMSEDSPDDLCWDKLSEAYSGKQGYGRTILGPEENILNFKRDDILEHLKNYYNTDNIIIGFAGSITMQKAKELVEKYFLPYVSCEKSKKKPSFFGQKNHQGRIVVTKQIEQNHIGLAFDGLNYMSDDLIKQKLADLILGTGLSSRLFQKLREELGLCYDIGSSPTSYDDFGIYGITSAVSPVNTQSAINEIFAVLQEFKKNGVTREEFEKSKTQLLSSVIFGNESASTILAKNVRELQKNNSIYDMDRELEMIKSTSFESLNEFIKTMNFEEYSLALVGPDVEKYKEGYLAN